MRRQQLLLRQCFGYAHSLLRGKSRRAVDSFDHRRSTVQLACVECKRHDIIAIIIATRSRRRHVGTGAAPKIIISRPLQKI